LVFKKILLNRDLLLNRELLNRDPTVLGKLSTNSLVKFIFLY